MWHVYRRSVIFSLKPGDYPSCPFANHHHILNLNCQDQDWVRRPRRQNQARGTATQCRRFEMSSSCVPHVALHCCILLRCRPWTSSSERECQALKIRGTRIPPSTGKKTMTESENWVEGPCPWCQALYWIVFKAKSNGQGSTRSKDCRDMFTTLSQGTWHVGGYCHGGFSCTIRSVPWHWPTNGVQQSFLHRNNIRNPTEIERMFGGLWSARSYVEPFRV